MERNTLEKFFTGKAFIIPTYQRDYSWTQDNIDDLLSDLTESIETKTSHYIGTFILSRVGSDGLYHVVDGQQRLTTLTMILNAVVGLLPQKQKVIGSNTFIRDIAKKRWRLQPAEYNRAFFADLLEGRAPQPQSKSQRLLRDAYVYILHYIQEVNKAHGSLESYLESLKQLEVMEFIESDEGKAIRIFQTVNDRGRPLAVVEKAKSLLIYYSNRFLSGKLDGVINDSFGHIFKDFSLLKDIGENSETRIALIAQAAFSEDSVLRYHFLSFPNEFYDFRPTIGFVLDGFLKKSLKTQQRTLKELSEFITIYVNDLRLFFKHFLELIKRVEADPKYFKMFCILGISTHLYPLSIRLQGRGLLDQAINGTTGLTFANIIEIADVRIYKTRGTDPAKDISYLACEAATETGAALSNRLGEIVRRFMDDALFEVYLGENMYSNEAVLHMLIEKGEAWAKSNGGTGCTVQQLQAFMATNPTVEHIFSQTPTFGFPSRGFATSEQYALQNNRIGNLCVLEKDINSRCQNKTPDQKLEEPNLYKESKFDVTRCLVAEMAASGQAFVATSVDERTRAIAAFAKKRWCQW